MKSFCFLILIFFLVFNSSCQSLKKWTSSKNSNPTSRSLAQVSSQQQKLNKRLFQAVKDRYYPNVEELIELGADPNVTDEKGLKPIDYVSYSFTGTELWKYLDSKTQRPREERQRQLNERLFRATQDFSAGTLLYDSVQMLIELGADPNATDEKGLKPIDYVAYNSTGTMLWEYLDSKTQRPREERQRQLNERLFRATQSFSFSGASLYNVRKLIELGAGQEQLNRALFKAVKDISTYYATDYNALRRRFQTLIELGADPNATDQNGKKPIDYVPFHLVGKRGLWTYLDGITTRPHKERARQLNEKYPIKTP